jgi:hypothetical protein
VTTFRWPAALGGHQVAVCGSFSKWEPLTLHQASSDGDFVRSVALPPGSAYFKYLVDGEWVCSPCEQVTAVASSKLPHVRAERTRGWLQAS